MVLTQKRRQMNYTKFENDVNQYGSYTSLTAIKISCSFENDVNQYGSYTFGNLETKATLFENDVN